MKFDVSLLVHDLGQMPALARFADELGFDGIWTFETSHEPFLPLVLAAEHSRRLNIGTSIAVAFPRSPTITAQIAWDLARFSQGRFILGLGTQVKGHNERRFGVKWEKPVAENARLHSRRARGVGELAASDPAQLPGRILQADVDDAVLQSGAPSIFAHSDLRRWRQSRACASSPANYAKAFMSIRCTPNVTCARRFCRTLNPDWRRAAGCVKQWNFRAAFS